MQRLFQGIFALALLLSCGGCDKNGNFNLLSVDEDIRLGAQLDAQIRQDTAYTVLPEDDYPQAYNYLRAMVGNVLASDQVPYADAFAWKVTILEDDEVLNAFATPGGYMYVYTGLIKYLDNADQLAGVMGHEMGHAALRHTSRNLTREYGTDLLLQVVLGRDASGAAAQILRGLNTLRYSRAYEEEADEASVEYLAQTPQYACDAAAGFFVKLNQNSQGGRPPAFLSTHPNPENRVADIEAKADALGCSTAPGNNGDYDDLKAMLP